LGDRKVENLLATHAEAVVSANPGCLLQLMNGLRRRGLRTMPAFHLVELIDASIHNIPVDVLLNRR
jgi:glycolate oxidase iron-sulfur subunit